MGPRIGHFYQTSFPQLRGLTRVRPAARAVMEWAFAAGYEVVIATSPVFPLTAIQERLRWAGLDDFPYARITSFENSHFTKPRPEYLAEILAHLGRRPDEALMIGDDWTNDMAPPLRSACPTFGLRPSGASRRVRRMPAARTPAYAGAASALPSLTMPPPPASALPYLLSGNLAAMVGMLEGLPERNWTQRPTSADWSFTEIVCHLRDVETEVNLPRLDSLLSADNPFISGADTHPWAEERDYQSQSGPRALEDFIRARKRARKRTCALLGQLPSEAWNRPARHSLFGPTHLAEIVGWILDHDHLHLQQLRATRSKLEAGIREAHR